MDECSRRWMHGSGLDGTDWSGISAYEVDAMRTGVLWVIRIRTSRRPDARIPTASLFTVSSWAAVVRTDRPTPVDKTNKAATKSKKDSTAAKKDKDPNAPKKPLSSYFIFTAEQRQKFKQEHPDVKGGDVTKGLSKMWNSLDVNAKDVYTKKAQQQKDDYKAALEAYEKGKENYAVPDDAE
ncbi:hypothetical protein HK101_011844 [Irineochytrium annulatum]|nr:hypothetical protein HK101_011844 [Irineochytrium annulatum]